MKVKPGDIVKIKEYKKQRPSHWNSAGRMDHWKGQIVTIDSIWNGKILIKEDYGERSSGGSKHWYWREDDFTPIPDKLEDDLFIMD